MCANLQVWYRSQGKRVAVLKTMSFSKHLWAPSWSWWQMLPFLEACGQGVCQQTAATSSLSVETPVAPLMDPSFHVSAEHQPQHILGTELSWILLVIYHFFPSRTQSLEFWRTFPFSVDIAIYSKEGGHWSHTISWSEAEVKISPWHNGYITEN